MPEYLRTHPWRSWSSDAPYRAPGGDASSAIRAIRTAGEVSGLPVLTIGGRRLPIVGRARVYVCGITPYDATHLGHAATFVWADVAARVLRLTGAEVEVCRNITDVDDHLLARARADHVAWRSLAAQQTYRFEADMEALGVARPTYEPRSYDHVGDVIAIAAELVAAGRAYVTNGSVYFRGADVPARAGLDRDAALALAAERGGHPDDPDKVDPLDAALWQRSVGDEPAWDSPWGRGRPGWHAECTAMALATFGPTVDLHLGGAELAFPHHAYEAAQAEAYAGVAPFARAWMHVGTVMVDGRKMAKSAGNLVFVADLLERYPAGALRHLILSRPWDQPWEFRDDELAAAATEVEHLWSHAARSGGSPEAGRAVIAALLDDLDVPKALGLAKDAGGQALRELVGLLGLQ
ncbi:MAG TPA: class I tRNA ligase family protein [Acidimicrobiales bacterium]|nr:class I tRNA ligase family protein [Acidimicrobiales bacterium]